MSFDINIFGERLRELKTKKGLSNLELSKVLGVSNGIISRWENGLRIPSIENLYKIAKYFGVTADYLIGLEN